MDKIKSDPDSEDSAVPVVLAMEDSDDNLKICETPNQSEPCEDEPDKQVGTLVVEGIRNVEF